MFNQNLWRALLTATLLSLVLLLTLGDSGAEDSTLVAADRAPEDGASLLASDSGMWQTAALDSTKRYSVGFTEVVVDTDLNRTFLGLIFYPATEAGRSTPLDKSDGPYPAVAFGRGYLQRLDIYSSTFAYLASRGYIVIAPDTENRVFPSHSKLADDLRTSLTYIVEKSSDPGSLFHQAVDDTALGLTGHSMGGGAAILALSRDSRISAAATMAAADTSPSAISAAEMVRAPVLFIAAERDRILLPERGPREIYDSVPVPRQLRTILGASHCGFLDRRPPFGCDSATISGQVQLSLTWQLLGSWFDLYLKGESGTWPEVWGTASRNDSEIEFLGETRIGIQPTRTTLIAAPNSLVGASISITNQSPLTISYALGVSSPLSLTLSSTQTMALEPGRSTSTSILIETQDIAIENIWISVRSLTDGGTTDQALIQVDVRAPTPPPTVPPAPTPTATPPTIQSYLPLIGSSGP